MMLILWGVYVISFNRNIYVDSKYGVGFWVYLKGFVFVIRWVIYNLKNW